MAKKANPLIIIVLAIAVAGGAAWYMGKHPASPDATSASSASASSSTPAPSGGGRVRGQNTAPVTLVEFGDYQCPTCGYYAPIVQEVLRRYPAQLKLEFHHYPLVGVHQWAMAAALAAESAGDQGKFWEMHDLIYDHQEQWSKSQNAESDFLAFAGQLGLNSNQFMQSTRSPEVKQRVLQDVVRAREGKLDSTPTFFINGDKVSLPVTADELSRQIQDHLKK